MSCFDTCRIGCLSPERCPVDKSPSQRQQAVQELARRELERREATTSLEAFCKRMDDRFVSYRHTKAVLGVLEAIAKRDLTKLIITMPPRAGKSYLSSERFPAFVMASVPRSKLMLVAYNSDLAQGFSRKARDLANEPTWPFEGVQVSQSLSAVGFWGMTNGSEMRAGGFGGTLSGAGASVLIIDDPVKNSEEANSATHREKIWEFYGTTVRTRAERGCAQIVMLTRWNSDDLAGRILNSSEASKWHVLNLPAYAVEDNDAIGRSRGEELWPEGPPIPNPADGVISKRFFEALYQQAPTLESGDLFKREWLSNYYDRLPPIKRAAIFIDGGWKTGVSNSRSAMQIYGDDGVNYYLIDSWAARVEYPELKQAVKSFFIKHRDVAPTVFVCCEEAASGYGLIQELKRERFPRIPIDGVTVDKDKVTRAEATTPAWESGRVLVPRSADFMFDFCNEMLRFPGEPNDLVDCMSGAITKLSKSGLSLIMGSLSTVRRR
jgi:predicted phage terminase large subunit-like protein